MGFIYGALYFIWSISVTDFVIYRTRGQYVGVLLLVLVYTTVEIMSMLLGYLMKFVPLDPVFPRLDTIARENEVRELRSGSGRPGFVLFDSECQVEQ